MRSWRRGIWTRFDHELRGFFGYIRFCAFGYGEMNGEFRFCVLNSSCSKFAKCGSIHSEARHENYKIEFSTRAHLYPLFV